MMQKQACVTPSKACRGLYVPKARSKLTVRAVTGQDKDTNDRPLVANLFRFSHNLGSSNYLGSFSSQQQGKEYELKEDYRKAFRTVYDFPNWEKHRSQYRLIERLLQIPQSYVIQNIIPSLLWCGGVAAVVTAYNMAQEANQLPIVFPNLSTNAACTAFIQDTSVALSLLLVFRTNASYGRWDEARKMWGGLLNRSRDLMRQGCTLMPDDDVESKKALARWIIAFTRALRIHFQPESTLQQDLEKVLTPAELEMLKDSPHRPVKAIHVLSQVIQNSEMHAIDRMQISQNLTFYQDVLGGCERLLRAPIPLSYTRHTARFLFAWLTLLPFAVYSSCGIWTTPVVLGVAAVLCGIEEIGVQCEEPFGILPLEVICNRIQADVMQTLNEDEETKAVLRESMNMKLTSSTAVSQHEVKTPEPVKAKTSNGVPPPAVSSDGGKARRAIFIESLKSM